MTNILIGAGHGERPDGTFDNGAVNPKDKAREHELNKAVATYCVKRLESYGFFVGFDAAIFGSAHEPNWQGLIKYLHDSPTKWNLAVEIHHDSYNAAKAGFGILPRTSFFDRVSKLANLISVEYGKRGLRTKASYRDVRGLGFLRSLKTPTLIWECNVTANTPGDVLVKRGEAIADGIAAFYGKIPGVDVRVKP